MPQDAALDDDDDDLLYEDLKPLRTSNKASNNNNNLPLSLVDQVAALEETVKALRRENDTLKRNVGTLYRTAKREIQRKDDQILKLMQEVDDAKVSR